MAINTMVLISSLDLEKMHLFKFYIEEKGNDMGWLVMRYKIRSQILPM